MIEKAYDIIIIGGSLSGCLLANELKERNDQLRIAVLEKEGAFGQKVGESTTDIASIYLRKYYPELVKKHADKSGLRFLFNTNTDDIIELDSPAYIGPNNGFHLDRKKFDEELFQLTGTRGVDMFRPVTIKKMVLDPFDYRVELLAGNDQFVFSSARMIDATGRSSILPKKLGWKKIESPLKTNASMAYLSNVDWSIFPDHRSKLSNEAINHHVYSTLHVMDKRSWWWIIKINENLCSIGRVCSSQSHEQIIDEEEFSRSLKKNRLLNGFTAKAEISQFKSMRQLAYCYDQLHQDGIAVIGDAGGFTDPLLSPGIEYVCQQAIGLSELINLDIKKEYSPKRWKKYENRFIRSFTSRMRIYAFGYQIIDHPQLLSSWIKLANFIYFTFYVIPAMTFGTIKKPFNIGLIGNLGFSYMKRRLSRLGANGISRVRRKQYTLTGIKLSNSFYTLVLPTKLFFIWLTSYLSLECQNLWILITKNKRGSNRSR